MSKTYIADKDTLDAVNGKIGTKDDAPSPNPISLFAGIKQLLNGLSDHMVSWTGDRAVKVDYLDTTVGSRAPANTALSTAQWTNARAGYLDKLNNSSYGLEALKGYVDEVENLLKNTTYGLNALKSEITVVKNATNNYNPYPEPDADGVYPYIYGMGVKKDMLVRDDGAVYRCILNTGEGDYKLLYAPSTVPALFTKEAE